jgi:hypothetical protein
VTVPALTTGTHSDIAATDQIRPIATSQGDRSHTIALVSF